jgi:hypothetical protein
MTKSPCGLWYDLLYDSSPYASSLFDEFAKEKNVLTEHLDDCTRCQIMVGKLLSAGGSTADFKDMPTPDFVRAIRMLWKISRQRTTETP